MRAAAGVRGQRQTFFGLRFARNKRWCWRRGRLCGRTDRCARQTPVFQIVDCRRRSAAAMAAVSTSSTARWPITALAWTVLSSQWSEWRNQFSTAELRHLGNQLVVVRDSITASWRAVLASLPTTPTFNRGTAATRREYIHRSAVCECVGRRWSTGTSDDDVHCSCFASFRQRGILPADSSDLDSDGAARRCRT